MFVRREPPAQYGRKYLPKVHLVFLSASSPFRSAHFDPSLRLTRRGRSVVFGDRYCFLFPRGTLGQFQIAGQRSQRAYRSKCTSAIFRANRRFAGGIGSQGGMRGNSTDVSQFPQSTRYERFPRQISLIELVSFTSQERNCPRR